MSRGASASTTDEPAANGVGVVLPDLGAGGAQKVAVWLIRHLVAEGIRCSVVQTTDRPEPIHDVGDEVVVRTVRPPPRWWPGFARSALRVVRLRRELKGMRPGVVLAMVGSTNVITALAGLRCPWRTVLSERNDPVRQPLRWPWGHLRRACYRLADIVTANSRDAARVVARWVPPSDVRVIPNAVELPPRRKAGHGSAQTIVIVGRLHEQKAHDVLFRAWAGIVGLYPQWRLVVVGDGELRESLEALCARLSISDRVDWRGQVEDVAAELNAASIFALPSRYEGTPNALLEAMAHGLACVVSDSSPGPLDLVRDEETGLVAPVDDPDALGCVLARLMDDAALRARLGQAARASMQAYDPERVLALWKDVLFGDGRGVAPR